MRRLAIPALLVTASCRSAGLGGPPVDGGDERGAADATGQGDGGAGNATLHEGGGAGDGSADVGDAMSSDEAFCPPAVPLAGTPCAPPYVPYPFEAVCEYGSDLHCTTSAQWEGDAGAWVVQPCKGNASACPPAFDADAGGSCAVPRAQGACNYPEGQCGCVLCGGVCDVAGACGPDASPDATTWQCKPWLTPTGCPSPRPLLGTACPTTQAMECDYGYDCFCGLALDPQMGCIEGHWVLYIGGGC